MGTYTELVLKCRVKKDVPENVRDVLNFLFAFKRCNFDKQNLPDHDFFKEIAWEAVGICSSYYHIPQGISFFDGSSLFTRFDMKNYNNEIEKFLDWIFPYLDEEEGQFLGWIMLEENHVTFIYMKKQ